MPTRPLTVASPVAPPPVARPRPYPPPQPLQPEAESSPGRSNATLRMLLMIGLLCLVALGTALAPYVTAVVALAVAWLVRTTSWSLDAIADRRALKGPRRSDPVVRTLAVPWHLVASAPGTVILLLSACGSAGVFALILGAFGLQDSHALFAAGVLGAVTLWWGPGSRRLRRPVRRVVWHVSRSDTSGAAWTGLVYGGVVVLLVALGSVGVQWFPDDGPPIDPSILVPPGFQSR